MPWRRCTACRTASGSTIMPTLHYADLRHYFASVLIAGGCDVKAVQAAMRHGTASMTLDVYAGLWPDADDRARSAASAALAKRPAARGRTADDHESGGTLTSMNARTKPNLWEYIGYSYGRRLPDSMRDWVRNDLCR